MSDLKYTSNQPSKAVIAARKKALFKSLEDPEKALEFLMKAKIVDKRGRFIRHCR